MPLQSLPPEELGRPVLLEELRAVYALLTREGVVHGNPRLYNVLLVGGARIVAIDFELAYPVSNDITNEDGLETLKTEMGKREGRPRGVGAAPLGFGMVFRTARRWRGRRLFMTGSPKHMIPPLSNSITITSDSHNGDMVTLGERAPTMEHSTTWAVLQSLTTISGSLP